MYQEGHYGAALLAYAPVGFVALLVGLQQLGLLGLVVVAGLATLPDQDQRIPRMKHRGITHTVWFAILVGSAVAVAGGYVGSILDDGSILAVVVGVLFGFFAGALSILSHIAADALTPMGVSPFSPVDDRHYSLDIVRASNHAANRALLMLGVAAAGLMLVLPRII